MITNFIREDEGATAIEYGLIAALVGLAIVVGATALGGGLNKLFTDVSSELATASTVN